jgi:alpha-L-fucosidase 2
LSLNAAVSSCSYVYGDVRYTREYFTSFSEDVSIVSVKADKAGRLNFTISLSRPERSTTSVEDGSLVMRGQLRNGTDGNGMQFFTQVNVKLKGGKLRSEANNLVVVDADEATLFISAGTDFKDKDFLRTTETHTAQAMKLSYNDLKFRHGEVYKKMFDRVRLKLSGDNKDGTPTDQRLIDLHCSFSLAGICRSAVHASVCFLRTSRGFGPTNYKHPGMATIISM